jgi:MFS family permease
MTNLRKLLPLYCVIFLGFFGYALTLTLFIPMLLDKHVPILPIGTSMPARAALSGLLLATYPLGQFLASPVIGNLSDHFGRKKVLLITLGLCIFGFLGMGLSIVIHSLGLLFLFAFLTGLCESNMAISQSVIADLPVDSAQASKLMGYAFAACSLGYIIGPIVGGASGSLFSYSTPFWVTAGGVVFLIIWIGWRFHDDFVPNSATRIKLLTTITSIKSIFRKPKLSKIYLINFLIFFAVMGLYRIVPLYVMDKWKPTLHVYALLISFVSLLCFLANLFILDKLAKRYSTKKLLGSLLVIGGILVILIIIPTHFNWIWLTYGAAVIPTVMALPTCTTWLSKHAKSNEQGQALGNNQALLVLGESSSAAIGGAVAAIFIPLPVVMLGVMLLITGIFAFKST